MNPRTKNPRTFEPSNLRTLWACPLCVEVSNSLLAEGARAGTLALALVTLVVLCGFVRFAWRLRSAERERG